MFIAMKLTWLNKVKRHSLRSVCYRTDWGIGLLRGLFLWIRSRGRVEMPCLVGRSCQIMYPEMIRSLSGLVLGNGGVLDANSTGGVSFGANVTISHRFWIQGTSDSNFKGDELVIRDDVYIGPNAVIGFHGRVEIGERCAIGANFCVSAQEHDTSVQIGINLAQLKGRGVLIGRDCWLGNGVQVLDGVHIGECAIVGAGAVVTRSLPAYCVAVGVPAKVIKIRKS